MEQLQKMVAEAKAAFNKAMPPRPGKDDANAFQARSGDRVVIPLGIKMHEAEWGGMSQAPLSGCLPEKEALICPIASHLHRADWSWGGGIHSTH